MRNKDKYDLNDSKTKILMCYVIGKIRDRDFSQMSDLPSIKNKEVIDIDAELKANGMNR